MRDNININEYLMLREEVQSNLKMQQTWSTLSITSVLTFIGVAVRTEIYYFYLIPIIVLLLASVKVKNYKFGITRIVEYMIVRCESPEGFFWETCLKEFRQDMKSKEDENKVKMLADKFFSFLETQEMSLMGVICLLLYSFLPYWTGNAGDYSNITFWVLFAISFICLIIIVFSCSNYWTLNPIDIESSEESWRQIIENAKNKSENEHAE